VHRGSARRLRLLGGSLADIAIIYAHEDRETTARLEQAFSEFGWSVWWDNHLSGESFPIEIQQQIKSAKCVVVVWSASSVERHWVLEEARFAKESARPLLQIRIDSAVIPIGFGQDEVIDLSNWRGAQKDSQFSRLLSKLSATVGAPLRPQLSRALKCSVDGRTFGLPAFFRSVSSHETQLSPEAAVRALEILATDAVLVSAYDLIHAKVPSKIRSGIRALRKKGATILIDSGNYEAYRKSDSKWNAKSYYKALNGLEYDLAFCFDNLRPQASASKILSDVISRVRADSSAAESTRILPIVHLPTRAGRFRTEIAADLFVGIAEALGPPLIAVPERELGGGVLEKARVIRDIRSGLNSTGRYQAIHLLGTGNPLSIAIFAAAGADSFDGLEWCRTVADHETALLYHFQQYDLFRNQTRSAGSPIVKAVADDEGIPFNAKVAFHNLEFYGQWTKDVQKDIAEHRIDRLLRHFLPADFTKELARVIPEAFQR
jgi:queuine/archaeosine tRNA-ribosyltransferase